MIEEILDLQRKLENKFDSVIKNDPSMLAEWQEHPVTKAFKSSLVAKYIESIDKISDMPTCEHTRAEHASGFGARQMLQDLLDSEYFERGTHEE